MVKCSYCGKEGHSIQECPEVISGRSEVATAHLYYYMWTIGQRVASLEIFIEERKEEAVDNTLSNLEIDISAIQKLGYDLSNVERLRQKVVNALRRKNWLELETAFHDMKAVMEDFVAHELAKIPRS